MIYDLSHQLEEHQPSYPTHAKFYRMMWNDLELGDRSAHAQLIMGEHSATHVDAPSHFLVGGASVDVLELDRFMGLARCLDFSDLSAHQTVAARRIEEWESRFGAIQANEIVLFHYGWDKHWGVGREAHRYREGWPGLSVEAAELLVRRRVKSVGTDAISIDSSAESSVEAHRVLLPAGVLIYENLAGLTPLANQSFQFAGVPLRIAGGTGSPVRAYAVR